MVEASLGPGTKALEVGVADDVETEPKVMVVGNVVLKTPHMNEVQKANEG